MRKPNAAPAHTPEWMYCGHMPPRSNFDKKYRHVIRLGGFAEGRVIARIEAPTDHEAKDAALHLLASANALEGVADPAAVRALREAAREAERALDRAEAVMANDTPYPGYSREEWGDTYRQIERTRDAIRAALAAFPEVTP